jgi:hypothetical protein
MIGLIQMKNFLALSVILTTLAACAGAPATDQATRSQASTGYATGPDDDPAAVTFTVTDTPFLMLSETDISQSQQNLTVELSEDGSTLTLVVDGEQIILNRNADDLFVAPGAIPRAAVSIQEPSADRPVSIYFVTLNLGNEQVSAGSFAVGFDTDPNTVAATTGQVNYAGVAVLNAAQIQDGGAEQTVITGTFDLNADFDSPQTVSGSMSFDAVTDVDELQFPEFSLDILPGSISGNGFSGDIGLQDGSSLGEGRTLDDMGYDGRFYGVAAEDVAGTVAGTVTEVGGNPIFLQGVLASSDSP